MTGSHNDSPSARHEAARRPTLLSRTAPDGQVTFYVVGDSRRELGELIGVLRAYLGRLRSTVEPRVDAVSSDADEAELLGEWPAGFVRVRMLNPAGGTADVRIVSGSIQSALAAYANRARVVEPLRRPVGRVLSDFFIACDRLDGAAAQALLEELRASGTLSPRNLISLELQVRAACGDWHGILRHPRLDELLNRRVPVRIVELLLTAVGRTELSTTDPDGLDRAALRVRLDFIAPLFYRPPGLALDAPVELWKIWVLGAATFGYIDGLNGVPAAVSESTWLTDVLRWTGAARAAPTTETVISAPPVDISFAGAVRLLNPAALMDAAVAEAAYRTLSGFPAPILEQLERHSALRALWRSLRDDFETQRGVASWRDWIRSLVQSDGPRMSLQALDETAARWAADTWDETGIIADVSELPGRGRTSEFRDGVPVLRKWLEERALQPSADLTVQMLLLLALDDLRSPQDTALAVSLIGDLLTVAHSGAQYREAVGAAIEIWSRTRSVRQLDEGIELLDVLLDSPCADSEVRGEYWRAVQEFALTDWRRLSPEQRSLVRQASLGVTGTDQQLPPDESLARVDSPDAERLAGKRLGIYTLMEGAARRAKAVLAAKFPGLDIAINSDHTATASLINLANTADYFIFASQSATHQAFFPVTARRKDVLYPTGRGSSSLVNCFLRAVA